MSSAEPANQGRKQVPYFRMLDADILFATLREFARENGFSDVDAEVCSCAALRPEVLNPQSIAIGRIRISGENAFPGGRLGWSYFVNRYVRVQGANFDGFCNFISEAASVRKSGFFGDPRADKWHIRVLNLIAVEMITGKARIHRMSYSPWLRKWELARRWHQNTGSTFCFCLPGVANKAKFTLAEDLTDNHRVALVKEMKGETSSNDTKKDEKSRAAIAKLRCRLAERQGAELRRYAKNLDLPFDVGEVSDQELPELVQEHRDREWLKELDGLEGDVLEQAKYDR